jgi:hypothetical protein
MTNPRVDLATRLVDALVTKGADPVEAIDTVSYAGGLTENERDQLTQKMESKNEVLPETSFRP